jgi:hypothetical protein
MRGFDIWSVVEYGESIDDEPLYGARIGAGESLRTLAQLIASFSRVFDELVEASYWLFDPPGGDEFAE